MQNKLHGEYEWEQMMKMKRRYRANYDDGMILEESLLEKLPNPNKNGAYIVSMKVIPLLPDDMNDDTLQKLTRIVRSGNAYYILAKEEGQLPKLMSNRYTTGGCDLTSPYSSHQRALWEELLTAMLDELKKIELK